jgi:hypothetical protein
MFPETMLLLASEPHQVPGNEKSQTLHEKLNHQGIILSHLPSSIIETLVHNTLMSIPPSYTNHFNKEYNMKTMEPKILNYTNLYRQHSQATEESKGRNSCMSNQARMTIIEARFMKLVLVRQLFCQEPLY